MIGAKRLDQLDDNIAATKVLLEKDELDALDKVSALPDKYPTLDVRASGRVPAQAAGIRRRPLKIRAVQSYRTIWLVIDHSDPLMVTGQRAHAVGHQRRGAHPACRVAGRLSSDEGWASNQVRSCWQVLSGPAHVRASIRSRRCCRCANVQCRAACVRKWLSRVECSHLRRLTDATGAKGCAQRRSRSLRFAPVTRQLRGVGMARSLDVSSR